MFHALQEQHYCITSNFIDKRITERLLINAHNIYQEGHFRSAQIGNGGSQQKQTEIRNAELYWINNWKENSDLDSVYSSLNRIKETLNKTFFVSIKRFESQLSYYPIGGYYKKHVDQLQNTRNRQATSILFLNDIKKGGELVLYDKEDKGKIKEIIKPKAGTHVLFFSKTIYHEVLECKQDRYGLTTWFRDDDNFFPHTKNTSSVTYPGE